MGSLDEFSDVFKSTCLEKGPIHYSFGGPPIPQMIQEPQREELTGSVGHFLYQPNHCYYKHPNLTIDWIMEKLTYAPFCENSSHTHPDL